MNLYLDSSAWVKLYVAEPDRPPFIQAVSGADRLIAHLITYAEVHAAFAKRFRMGDLTGAAHDQCLSQFEGDWADTLVVQVEEHIVRSAAGASDDYAFSRHCADPSKTKVYGFTVECGHSFQPTWSEAEEVIREVSAGLIAFCLETAASAPGSIPWPRGHTEHEHFAESPYPIDQSRDTDVPASAVLIRERR